MTDKLKKALEREREIVGHLMVNNPHPQIWKELLEAQAYTDTLEISTTEGAVRYTVIEIKIEELESRHRACMTLGLHYFIISDTMYGGQVSMYIFFDLAGLRNYMRDLYEDSESLCDQSP